MKKEHINQIQLYISNTLCHPIDNSNLILLYYQIGAYLSIHCFSSHDLKILEWELQRIYGIVIGFTKRNFVFMIQFYHSYFQSDLPILQTIPWNHHLYLLKIKDSKERRQALMRFQSNDTFRKTISNHRKKMDMLATSDYMLTEIQKLQQKLLYNK